MYLPVLYFEHKCVPGTLPAAYYLNRKVDAGLAAFKIKF